MLIKADRVQETTTTVGVGDLTLAGAATGFRSFGSVCANLDTFGYAVVGGTEWETGIGTYNTGANSITRSIIAASSNANAAVNLSAGTKSIYLSALADQVIRLKPILMPFPTITGLVLRLSAEFSPITLTTDNRITQVNDLSGGWGNFNNPGGNTRPRWFRTMFNGVRPAILFDGTSTYLIGPTKVLAQPCTVVTVAQNWNRGTSNIDMYRDSTGGPVFFVSSSVWTIFAGASLGSSGMNNQNREAQRPNEAAPFVSIQVYNGATGVLSNNGVEVTGNVGATGFGGTLNIGRNNTGGMAGFELYEFLIFNKALSPAERTQINQYYATAVDIQL